MEQTCHALIRGRTADEGPRVTMAPVSCRNIKRRAPSAKPVNPLTQRLINTCFNKYCFYKINIEFVIRCSCSKTYRIDFTSLQIAWLQDYTLCVAKI